MRKIKSEQIRFDVIINGNKAQKELYDLEKANRNLTNETKALRLEKLKLERAGKTESKEYKQTTALLREKNATLKLNKARMSELQQEIGLTGLTMHQLQQRARQLNLQLRHMIPGSKERVQMENDLKKINARLTELRLKGRQAESSISKLSQTFNKYAALGTAVIATTTGVVFSLQRFIDFNNKVSDAQADVMKTTSMTRHEVDELTKSFGELNTRTSRMDLLTIAREGGRLGLPKEEIGEFVEFVNIATVALADGFTGGVEEVAPMLGKLKFLFEETKDAGVAEAYSEIGSALNELAKNGISTEKNIAEFATRVGALPPALKPAISDALALGAAFEESGINAEVGSRAWGIVLRQATTNTEKFARVMGKTNQEIVDLINQDPTEFMLQFGEALKGASATDIGAVFQDLGTNADGAIKAIGALTGNTDRFRQMMEISKVGMEEATSMMDEYIIKNNNLAAVWEKIQKRFRGLFLSENLVKGLEAGTIWFAKFIGATEDADGKVTKFRNTLMLAIKMFAVGLVAVVSYNAAIRLTALYTAGLNTASKLYTITQRGLNTSLLLGRKISLFLQAAYFTLTGQITRARAAMVLFNRTATANPLGLLVAGALALYSAYRLFNRQQDEALTKQKALKKASLEASQRTIEQVSNLETLRQIAEDVNASEDKRIDAIEKLNKIIPGYNENLDLSTEALKEGRKAIDAYVDGLHKQMKVQALKDNIIELEKELAEVQNKSAYEYVNTWDKVSVRFRNLFNSTAANVRLATRALSNQNDEAQKIQDNIKLNREALKDLLMEGVKAPTSSEESDLESAFNLPSTEKVKDYADKLYKLLQDELKARNELISDDLERELDMLEVHHLDKLKLLHDELEKGAALNAEQIAINESIHSQMLLQEEIYQRNKATILQKAIEQEMKDADAQFKREQRQRETLQNNELAALGENKEARKKLEERHRQENLKLEEEYLLQVLELYNKTLADSEFRGMSLDILTDEQRDQIIENLEAVEHKVSQLRTTTFGDEDESRDANFAERQDILGFTAVEWMQTFENLETTEQKIEAIAMVMQGLQNAWAMFNQFASNNDRKRLQEYEAHNDAMRQKADRRLELGYINERQHARYVEELDEELARHKAEFEYKEAKRKKEMTLAGIAQNTALGITAALTSIPPNVFLSGIIGTIGAAQLAVAASTPLPAKGYEKGLYPVQREQDGKNFKARYGGMSGSGEVDFPTLFLAGEEGKNKPEMIISGGHYKRFDPGIKALLHSEINRVRGFEDGHYPEARSVGRESQLILQLLADNIITIGQLNEILEKGVEARMVSSMENADRMDRMLTKHKHIKESSRI